MIDYASSLNAAQLAAVTAGDGPTLVVAGAGSGKTRTIVYRLAWLAEHGVEPHSLLLLTFTRKAAQEMLQRASQLLGQGLGGVQGGTFHSFAYAVLRQFRPAWLEGRPVSLMDSGDVTAAVQRCKDELGLGRGDRSFPKSQHAAALFSKARNKELPLDEVIRRDAFHLMAYAEDLERLDAAYRDLRRSSGLLDYDDLLFELEKVLLEDGAAAAALHARFRHVMVDEYQDTNLVQARIVRLLAGDRDAPGNVMAVGDEAQSIYAFRGADVRNILDFPKLFPGARVICLEENYRSTQPVLDVANAILSGAPEGFKKKLFTSRPGGEPVRQLLPVSDITQAEAVVRRIRELLSSHPPHEIAVLFRAGFHSYHLEMALGRAGIAFRKCGGLKYTEAAHVRDVMAYARLLLNPADLPAFERVAALHRGVGPKTARRLYNTALSGNAEALDRACARFPGLRDDLRFLDDLRLRHASPPDCMGAILEQYRPRLEESYPDDWPRRQQGLEEIAQMSSAYRDLDLFLADVALESPEEEAPRDEAECITLSTVHSAKGLEWNAVIILDLVEDRFPSRHAAVRPEEFEEERRLLYVACTRARQSLDLCVPASLYSRQDGGCMPSTPSPFIRELPSALCETWVEGYNGTLVRRAAPSPAAARPAISRSGQAPAGGRTPSATAEGEARNGIRLGFCRHKIFGRGKAVKFIPPDKMQVHFPGLGIKTILVDYLRMETEE